MKIQKVVELTGLNKKTIHFYINKELITPSQNSENGYYCFNHEDVTSLTVIQIMRRLGMPLTEVSRILSHPNLTHFYLHRHLERQKTQLKEQLESIECLNHFVNELSIEFDLSYLVECWKKAEQTEYAGKWSQLQTTLPNREAELVSMLVWSPFLCVPMTEYRQYLWNKINANVEILLNEGPPGLRKYFQALGSSVVEKSVGAYFSDTETIAALTPDQLDGFVAETIKGCRRLVENPVLKSHWKVTYTHIILPLIPFIFGETGKLMAEYNPKYASYLKNLSQCRTRVRSYLLSRDGQELHRLLLTALDGKFDLEPFDGGIIGFLHIFESGCGAGWNLEGLRALLEQPRIQPKVHFKPQPKR